MLEKVCDPSLSNLYYIFTVSSYKKLSYYGYHTEFIQKITPYYYKSKRYYLERETSYKTFTTIIRQICKSHRISIHSKLNYSNSSYMMDYYISRKEEPEPEEQEGQEESVQNEPEPNADIAVEEK